MSEQIGERWGEVETFLAEATNHPEVIYRWLDERYTNVTYLRFLLTSLLSDAKRLSKQINGEANLEET